MCGRHCRWSDLKPRSQFLFSLLPVMGGSWHAGNWCPKCTNQLTAMKQQNQGKALTGDRLMMMDQSYGCWTRARSLMAGPPPAFVLCKKNNIYLSVPLYLVSATCSWTLFYLKFYKKRMTIYVFQTTRVTSHGQEWEKVLINLAEGRKGEDPKKINGKQNIVQLKYIQIYHNICNKCNWHRSIDYNTGQTNQTKVSYLMLTKKKLQRAGKTKVSCSTKI